MSKLFEHYQNCKLENPDKTIIIKSGTFCLFLDDDARKVSEKLGLKLVMLNEKIVKCGFPVNSLPKYEKMLIANSINYLISDISAYKNECNETEKRIIREIRDLDVENISPVSAINLLIKYNEKLKY